jgi:hypothetical protein
MDAAVGDLFAELDRLHALRERADALLAGVGGLRRLELAARDAELAALRRRAEAAEAERDVLRARLAARGGDAA